MSKPAPKRILPAGTPPPQTSSAQFQSMHAGGGGGSASSNGSGGLSISGRHVLRVNRTCIVPSLGMKLADVTHSIFRFCSLIVTLRVAERNQAHAIHVGGGSSYFYAPSDRLIDPYSNPALIFADLYLDKK
jgi:hypothetical protein